ncbi:MAG: sulfur carrier protein ThiS [SAR202 cluster bacterium]|nr:sulfur carrier protein ThiS [SAR202 cluster bacterium]|tara:strand:- start:64 stop:276 length:213 start_codon:yes stop_codon:yes gene_type:complete
MKNQIEIILNGESKIITKNLPLNQLIKNLRISNKSIAVAINGDVIEKSRLEKYLLQNQDKIEIVHAVGGG